jgi:MoaA/NifB/PqqE/SkfB family radical SAM enzyme
VRRQPQQPRLIARSVLQKANFRSLAETIEAVQSLQVDRLSFLAADVTSTAFNRRVPWDERTQAEIALGRDELSTFAAVIMDAERRCAAAFANGFVEGGAASLYRIHEHYAALAGLCKWPRVRCNAPWISAVLESDGRVRPCFFQPAYETAAEGLANSIHSPQAVSFRRDLDVRRNEICQRCVCSLSLPLTARV